MAQTYQMKHNPAGTIYSLLTVESDGQMTMTFHGTDREISHEATLTEDGRIATGGSLFPGLESGKWNKMDDGRWKMEEVQGTVPVIPVLVGSASLASRVWTISHQTSAIRHLTAKIFLLQSVWWQLLRWRCS